MTKRVIVLIALFAIGPCVAAASAQAPGVAPGGPPGAGRGGFAPVVIGPPDGNMQHYLQSLARLQREPITRIAPGHGVVIEDAQGEIARLIAHRLQREAKVAERLRRAGRATLDVLVTSVYDDVDPRLHPVAKGSLLAHLLKLEADGRAARDDAADATWWMKE